MESYFLSETTKYLYLIWSDSAHLIDYYVLSTEGHLMVPLPATEVWHGGRAGERGEGAGSSRGYVVIPRYMQYERGVMSDTGSTKGCEEEPWWAWRAWRDGVNVFPPLLLCCCLRGCSEPAHWIQDPE